MSESPQQSQSAGGFLCGGRWLVVVLVVYALGTGPVQKLEDEQVLPEGSMWKIYAPLEAVCEAVPPVQTFFLWYIYGVWRCEFLTHYP